MLHARVRRITKCTNAIVFNHALFSAVLKVRIGHKSDEKLITRSIWRETFAALLQCAGELKPSMFFHLRMLFR